MHSAPGLVDALAQRVRDDGARPLLTWYHPADGARVEFSATTFANWVDKAVNLLGALGADDRPLIGEPLLFDHPGHWMSLVWAQASWQVGGELRVVDREQLNAVDVAIVGPQDAHPVPGAETIACSLHPLGMGFTPPPAGVTDASELLSEPDVHVATPAGPDEIWVWFGDESRTGGQLAQTPPDASRVLLRPDAPVELIEVWAAILMGGGSLVLVDAARLDDAALQHLVDTEQVTRIVGAAENARPDASAAE